MSSAQGTPISVAIVEDVDVVVHGVAGMLARFADRVTFLGRRDATDLGGVDVVLFDAPAVSRRGTVTTPALRRVARGKIVVYSWHTGPGVAARSLAAGADGYIPKSAAAEQLVDDLEQIHHGLPGHGPGLDEGAVEDDTPSADAPSWQPGDWPGAGDLTPRETEVLRHIGSGATNQEIADRCFLSVNTVKTYVRTAYNKIGVTRRADAVRWTVDHGLTAE